MIAELTTVPARRSLRNGGTGSNGLPQLRSATPAPVTRLPIFQDLPRFASLLETVARNETPPAHFPATGGARGGKPVPCQAPPAPLPRQEPVWEGRQTGAELCFLSSSLLEKPDCGSPERDSQSGERPRRRIDAADDFLLRLYLRDISCASQLNPTSDGPSAWLACFQNSVHGQLLLENLERVVRIAFEYRGLGLPLGDLISEGNLGLMRAAQLFNPVRNVRFSHYARPWIRVHMQRALSYQAWPVSLPADLNWRRGRVRSVEENLTAKLNRQPGDAELAGACGLGLPVVRRLRAPVPSFVPLDSLSPGSEAGLTLAEVIPDPTSPAPDQEACRRSNLEYVHTLVAGLNPSEQRVIRLRYGLDGACGRSLEEVGGLLGYGRQGIHRIEQAALAKLRQRACFLEQASTLCCKPRNRATRGKPDKSAWGQAERTRLLG